MKFSLTTCALFYSFLLFAQNILAKPEFSKKTKTMKAEWPDCSVDDPNYTSHHCKDVDKDDKLPEVPEEVVEIIMHDYPEIAMCIAESKSKRANKIRRKKLLLVGQTDYEKTTVLATLAQELNRKIIYLDSNTLFGNEYRNSVYNYFEAKLDRVMYDMEQNPDTKYVIIIDEIVHLLARCDREEGKSLNILPLLEWMVYTFNKSDQVLFIATANKTEDLPKFLRPHRETDIIEINVPSADHRRNILLNCLKKQHNLSKSELEKLVEYTEGLTQRQIKSIVGSGALISYRKKDDVQTIAYEALEKAIGKVKDISFMGRRVYGPVNNHVIKPFNKFFEDNKDSIEAVQNTLGIGCVLTAMVYGFLFRKAITARVVAHAKAREDRKKKLLFFGLLAMGYGLLLLGSN